MTRGHTQRLMGSPVSQRQAAVYVSHGENDKCFSLTDALNDLHW